MQLSEGFWCKIDKLVEMSRLVVDRRPELHPLS